MTKYSITVIILWKIVRKNSGGRGTRAWAWPVSRKKIRRKDTLNHPCAYLKDCIEQANYVQSCLLLHYSMASWLWEKCHEFSTILIINIKYQICRLMDKKHFTLKLVYLLLFLSLWPQKMGYTSCLGIWDTLNYSINISLE